ncbi:MAG: hypothetical protein ABI780_01735 [Ardenticatenales bacterium]
MTHALGNRDPGPLVSRDVDGVEVRCPECNTPVLVIVPAAGAQVKTRCSDRRCRAWIVVIVALDIGREIEQADGALGRSLDEPPARR